jgi:DNA-binding MarR family transcriptional regulator
LYHIVGNWDKALVQVARLVPVHNIVVNWRFHMARSRFGELEEQVVLALLQLDGESYAVPVASELARLTGRDVSPATAYMVMRRLESRGFLTSRVGTPDPDRGGRPRRFYRVVTDAVIPALSASRQAMLALWEGLEPMLDKP